MTVIYFYDCIDMNFSCPDIPKTNLSWCSGDIEPWILGFGFHCVNTSSWCNLLTQNQFLLYLSKLQINESLQTYRISQKNPLRIIKNLMLHLEAFTLYMTHNNYAISGSVLNAYIADWISCTVKGYFVYSINMKHLHWDISQI